MADSIEEGWYPHPTNRALERYWDGTDWTDDVRYPVRDLMAPPVHTGGGLPVPAAGLATARTADEVFNPKKPKVNPRVEADRRAREAYSGNRRVVVQAPDHSTFARGTTSDPADMSLPFPGASPGVAFSRFWKGWAQFSGRASRSEFWWAYLFATLIGMIPLVGLLVIVPNLAVTARRLHDTNRSGWWMLLPVGAGFGAGFIAAFTVVDSSGQVSTPALAAVLALAILPGLWLLAVLCSPSKPEGARFD